MPSDDQLHHLVECLPGQIRRRGRPGAPAGTGRPPATGRRPHSATICWARMSSGATGGEMASRLPARTPASRAQHSTSSSRVMGKRRPLGRPPRWCPERPTRCRKVAMLRGEAIWHTSSTGPMSMPSSSDAVATRARSSPARSRVSTRSRRSLDRLPWWEATTSSPSRSPEQVGDALGQAPGVDEHQGGAVGLDVARRCGRGPRPAARPRPPPPARHRAARWPGRAGAGGRHRRWRSGGRRRGGCDRGRRRPAAGPPSRWAAGWRRARPAPAAGRTDAPAAPGSGSGASPACPGPWRGSRRRSRCAPTARVARLRSAVTMR